MKERTNKLPDWAIVDGRFSFLRNYILRNFYFKRYDFVSKFLVTEMDSNLLSHNRVLELGCGVGNFLDILTQSNYNTFGIDYSSSAIEKIDNRHNVIRGYIPPLPFRNSCFNIIIALGLTEHISNETYFIEEIFRVLKKNGVYICSIPIEIEIAGFIRHIIKCIVYRGKSFFNYSMEEIMGKTTREKHGTRHKYYNYKYLIKDLNEYFSVVDLFYWPRMFPSNLSPIIFAKCMKL